MSNQGTIYLLTNPAMPGMVKIGITYMHDTKVRMGQLYTTGVPVPFDCPYAAFVNDAEKVEAALHTAFAPHRVNPRREFFRIELAQAIAIIKLLEVKDETKEVAAQKESVEVDAVSLEAGEQLRKKRPRFSFEQMQIPIGSELISTRDGITVVRVIEDNLVDYQGKKLSLTAATREVLNLEYSVQPNPYWSYNGKILREIYNEVYPEE